MNKEKMIPFFAMAVLLVAMASSVYVYTVQSQLTVSADSIRIDDEEYSIDHLFDTIDPTTISLEEFDKTGIPLDNLIHLGLYTLPVGVTTPHRFSISSHIKCMIWNMSTIHWSPLNPYLLTVSRL